MTTNAVQTTQGKRDIRSLLQSDKVREQIALALPKHLTPERMMRVALTTINRTPKLQQCTPESLLGGLMLCSQVGLEPDGRNAHLIPYGDQVQVIFDWKGLVALARRNGVQNIAADTVCENDTFEWFRNADGLQFRHQVDWRKPRGTVFAAYCIWKDGDQFDGEVMQKDEIEGIRKRSRAGSNGPWITDWSEMAKKTVVRRASKKWPLDSETAGALNADDDSILPAAKTTRPVFVSEAPKLFEIQAPAEPEQLEAPAPIEDEIPMDYPAKPVEAAKPADVNYPKAIRALLRMNKSTESQLLDYMRTTGKLDESIKDLDEAVMVEPSRIKIVYDEWATVAKELKRVQGGAK